ncbi:MAG: glutathione peroxidase [Chloroflexi bacterium]|nr:glutathione peroxidase [Chloroflexota bacterium]
MSLSINDIQVTDKNGKVRTMSEFSGSVLLIVNVASQCGLTPQYSGLEALNRAYAAQGLKVVGFPCNDFGAQEPGTLDEIQQFCETRFSVTFELFDKVHAKGEKSPLYERLTQYAPAGDVTWNFEKFLVDRNGTVIGRFSPRVEPQATELVGAIEAAL